MDSHQVHWLREVDESVPCPVCQNCSRNERFLAVKLEGKPTDLYRCGTCQTCYFHPVRLSPYKDQYDEVAVQFYVEIGAGIRALVSPILPLQSRFDRRGAFLDVGCGFGFPVHYAKVTMEWDAVGVEPSLFADAGQQRLGIQLYRGFLEEVPELQSRQFDLVFSSEVLEHVPDPTAFVKSLLARLVDGGVLVLSTPNAAVIHEDLPLSMLDAVLSVGLHVVIFSRESLQKLLVDCGAEHVEILEDGLRLLAYASTKPFSDADRAAFRQPTAEQTPAYLMYLERAVEQENLDPSVLEGFAVRLYKEYITAGLWDKAPKVFDVLRESLERGSKAWVLDPDQVIAPVQAVRTSEDFWGYYPIYIAHLHYFRGMYALNIEAEYSKAAAHFRAAFELASRLLAHFGDGELTDLFWRMKYHEGMAHEYAGQIGPALAAYRLILDSQKKPRDEFARILPTQDVLEISRDRLNHWVRRKVA